MTTTSDRPSATVATRDPDAAAIEAVMSRFFSAFVSGPDCVPLLARLREDFLPDAIVVRTGSSGPAVYDVDGFIDPRRELLVSGALTGFREWELEARTDVAGDIAHRWCTYAKQWSQDGHEYRGGGTKSVQFVRVDGVWRIGAVAWADE